MHELSLCQAMLSQVAAIAAENGAAAVVRIDVIVGPLSGVEAPLLERAFSVARAGTPAADAVLEIDTGPVIVRCRSCGQSARAKANRLVCKACGDWRVDVLEGEDLVLKSVELSGIRAGAVSAGSPSSGLTQAPHEQGAG